MTSKRGRKQEQDTLPYVEAGDRVLRRGLYSEWEPGTITLVYVYPDTGQRCFHVRLDGQKYEVNAHDCDLKLEDPDPRNRKPLDYKSIPFHPAGEAYPLMPEPELEAMGANILAQKRLLNAIVIYEETLPDGSIKLWIADGRNRIKACGLVGYEPKPSEFRYVTDEDLAEWGMTIADLVESENLHRRHLTPEQRREVIAKLLKHDPTQSNRQVAGKVGADHKTVASVRKEKEATGEIPQLEKTAGKDGKKRKAAKPAKKKTTVKKQEEVVRRHERIEANGSQGAWAQFKPEEVEALWMENMRLKQRNSQLEMADGRKLPRGLNSHLRAMIQRWQRDLSLRHHPDRGGSNEAMAVVHDAVDLLLALLDGNAPR